jgi:hypothetical protein
MTDTPDTPRQPGDSWLVIDERFVKSPLPFALVGMFALGVVNRLFGGLLLPEPISQLLDPFFVPLTVIPLVIGGIYLFIAWRKATRNENHQ